MQTSELEAALQDPVNDVLAGQFGRGKGKGKGSARAACRARGRCLARAAGGESALPALGSRPWAAGCGS